MGSSQFKNLQSSKKLLVIFSVNSFVDILSFCEDKIILSSEFNGSKSILVNNLKPGLYFLVIDDKTSTKFVKY